MDLIRLLSVLGILCSIVVHLSSQNLVPNPGFESFTSCPVNINMGQPLECPPWIVPTGGTSDYFNACHMAGIVGVPNNIFGVQPAHTGEAYAGGLFHYASWPDYREYLQVQLTEPMLPNTRYQVSFWYSLSSFSCPIDKLGVHISSTQETDSSIYTHLPLTPQLELNAGLITGTDWQYFSECYFASGGEQWLTIGNFYSDAESMFGTGCPGMLGTVIAYLYFDDFYVEQGETLEIDLGPDQLLCETEIISYDFDPSLGTYLWQDNTTSPEYEINSPGLYAVTLTTYCGVVDDEIQVEVMSPPEPFDLGPDVTFCDMDQLVYDFDPALGDFLWQDGSMDPSYTIVQEGTYSLTISNECGSVEDEIIVEYFEEPEIDFNDQVLSLCEGDIISINLDEEQGEYEWDDGSEGPLYFITEPGFYSVTVTNPCGSDEGSILVEYTYQPVIDLGPDITLCPAQLPYTIDAVLTEHAENFLWSTGQSDASIAITMSGVYTLTVSNSCFDASDQITVTIEDNVPLLDLPNDTLLCPGESLLLDVSNIPGNYLWQDSSVTSTFNVTQSGVYEVSISSACGDQSDSIIITYENPLPLLNLGADAGLCPGDEITIDPVITGVAFLWLDGSTADTFLVTSTGTYALTISNECESVSDTIVVIEDAAVPVPDLPAQEGVCNNETIVLSTSASGVSYLWSTGDTGSSVSVSVAGMYMLTISNSCGSNADTTVVIDLGDSPVFDLGPDQSLCEGDTITFGPPVTGNFTWQDGSTDPLFESFTTEEIILTVANACGVFTDTVSVLVSPTIPPLDLGVDFSICPGDNVILAPGIPEVDYLWQDGSIANTFNVTGPGQIILTISNSCGTVTDTIDVAEDANGPNLTLGDSLNACVGETVLIDPGVPGVSYLWNDGSTGTSLLVSSSSEVILTISNSCGNATDTILVIIEGIPPMAFLGNDTLLCDGENLLLNVTDADSYSFEWQDGSTETSLLVSSAGVYSVSVTNLCGSATDQILITTGSSPVLFDLGPDKLICPGEEVTLIAPPPISGYELEWSTGSTSPAIDVATGGLYTLIASNECGSSTDVIGVTVDSQVINGVDITEYEYCEGDMIVIDASQAFDAGYIWNTGSTSPLYTIESVGVYTITITTACDELQQEIVVEEGDCVDHDIYIPNIFSPNGDQVNDFFLVDLDDRDVVNFYIEIFDRWGNLVCQSKDPGFRWNGFFKEKPLLPGVYVYQLNVERMIGTDVVSERYKGDVTLIR